MLNFYFLLTFQSCSITKERQREKRDKIENVQMKVTCWSCCCCCHYQILLLASCGATIGHIQLVAKLASEVFVPCNIYCIVVVVLLLSFTFMVSCISRYDIQVSSSLSSFHKLKRLSHYLLFLRQHIFCKICVFECNFHGLLQLFWQGFSKEDHETVSQQTIHTFIQYFTMMTNENESLAMPIENPHITKAIIY